MSPEARNAPSGSGLMVLAALSFSIMAVFVKLAARRLPVSEIVLFRALFSLVASYAMLRSAGVSPWGKRHGLLLARGVVGYLALLCVFYSVSHLPLADATTIQFLHPVVTAVIASAALRERIGRRLLAATMVGLVGVAIVARPEALVGAGTALPTVPMLVAITGAVLTAGAYVIVRSLASTERPLVIVFYFPLVAVPASLPMVLREPTLPAGAEWGLLLGVGIFAQAGQVLLTRGFEQETAARGTALSYLHVLFATVWGFVVFREIPTAWTAAGALLILASALWVHVDARAARSRA